MANPVLTRTFAPAEGHAAPPSIIDTGDRMTMSSVVKQTGLFFLILLVGAVYGWTQFSPNEFGAGFLWLMLGLFGLLIVTMIRPQWVRVTGPLFAAAEGVLVGAISGIYSEFYDGIVFQAILATFAVFAVMLFLYANRIIKVTAKLRSTIIVATAGIALFYVASIVLGLFGVDIPYVWDGGPLSILISVFIVGVAAFNLLLDFDIIERGVRQGAPGWMSWFAAFGLMVTVVWLYLELLRLLALTRD